MRLYELTGYKNHPLYHAIKGLKPNKSGDPSSSFDPRSMQKVIDQMEMEGWELLPKGWGYYSKVFGHPNLPYVAKIFYDDDGYSKYLELMQNSQDNPHVPKLRGKQMSITDKANVVRIEKLQKVAGVTDPIFKQYVDPSLPPTHGNLFDNPKNYDFLQENWPELWELLLQIKMYGRADDISTNNVMKRGNTLVITDPII